MHPNGIYGRLSAELKEAEARTKARLDRIAAGLNRILATAGLEPIEIEPEGDGGSPVAPPAAARIGDAVDRSAPAPSREEA